MSTPVTITPADGLVRLGANLDQPLGSFRSLVNCRFVAGGKLQQSPSFYPLATYTAGTWWDMVNATSAAETTTEPASLYYSDYNQFQFVANSQGIRVFGTRKPVVKQIVAPTITPFAPTLQKGCLLVPDTNYADLALGDILQVVIEAGGTTFKWRVNTGAYTTAVPIAAQVGVMANSNVYFLATFGFTDGDTWKWQRTDAFLSPISNSTKLGVQADWSYTIEGDNLYFVGADKQVMTMSISGQRGVRSVGYRPVFAAHVAIYEKHLILGDYSETAALAGTSPNSYIAWSDLGNYDNLIPTDVNEADFFYIPALRPAGNSDGSNGIQGIFIINSVLFVQTYHAFWSTQYFGLPIVFSFKLFNTYDFGIRSSTTFARPVQTEAGIYTVLSNGIWFFDGAGLSKISDKLIGDFVNVPAPTYYFPTTSPRAYYAKILFGVANPVLREIWFYHSNPSSDLPNGGFLIYQENTKTWYTRSASFSAAYPRAMGFVEGVANIAQPLQILSEDISGAQTTLSPDAVAGTSFTTPTIETQDISGDDVQKVKEIESLYLDAYYPIAPSSAYSNQGVKVEAAKRTYADETVTYFSSPTPLIWLTSRADGILSTRLLGARIYRFRLTMLGSSGKPPFGFSFNRLVCNLLGLTNKEVRK